MFIGHVATFRSAIQTSSPASCSQVVIARVHNNKMNDWREQRSADRNGVEEMSKNQKKEEKKQYCRSDTSIWLAVLLDTFNIPFLWPTSFFYDYILFCLDILLFARLSITLA